MPTVDYGSFLIDSSLCQVDRKLAGTQTERKQRHQKEQILLSSTSWKPVLQGVIQDALEQAD